MTTYRQGPDGDLLFPLQIETRPDFEVAQRLSNAFRSFRGEWYQDTRRGMPWFQDILGQKDLRLVESVVSRAALLVEGVKAVIACTATLDAASRVASIRLRVQSVSGRIIVGTVGAEFIVEGQQ